MFSPGVRDIDGEVVTDELRPAEEFPRPESKDMASPKYCAISSAVKFWKKPKYNETLHQDFKIFDKYYVNKSGTALEFESKGSNFHNQT